MRVGDADAWLPRRQDGVRQRLAVGQLVDETLRGAGVHYHAVLERDVVGEPGSDPITLLVRGSPRAELDVRELYGHRADAHGFDERLRRGEADVRGVNRLVQPRVVDAPEADICAETSGGEDHRLPSPDMALDAGVRRPAVVAFPHYQSGNPTLRIEDERTHARLQSDRDAQFAQLLHLPPYDGRTRHVGGGVAARDRVPSELVDSV